MKMSLDQTEIEEAIEVYIETKYFKLDGKHLEIEFLSGRSPPTVTADINIVNDATTAIPPDDPVSKETVTDAKETTKPFTDDQQKLPFSN